MMTSLLARHRDSQLGAGDVAPRRRWWGLDAAFLTGLADGSPALAYLFGANFASVEGSQLTAWYGITLAAKLALVCLDWRNVKWPSPVARFLVIAVSAMILATTLDGMGPTGPYVAAAGFLAHLVVTLLLVDHARLRRYLTAAGLVITFVAVQHIALTLAHKMPEAWGRPFYFGQTEPNVGGEIEAAAALGAAYAMPRLFALPLVGILAADTILLQARSAILVDAGVLVVLAAYYPRQRLTARRGLIMAVAAAVGISVLGAIGAAGRFIDLSSNLLMINDPYRGLGSGASGRTDLWNWAIDLFQASPLYGHSLNYFGDIGFIGAHNLFLHGLAQYGLMSLPFFGSLVAAYFILFRRDRPRFWVLVTALPLFLFNDRFLNLNPYPFMVYVMLLASTPPAAQVVVGSEPVRPWLRSRSAGLRPAAWARRFPAVPPQ
jgi:hypothetical protein